MARISGDNDDYDPRHRQVWPFSFYSVDEQWQHNACATMGLHFRGKTRLRPGGPNVALKRPDLRTVKRITADGNCLFRCFAYIITGSEDQHLAVRAAVVDHMVTIGHFLLGHGIIHSHCSVQEYIRANNIDKASAWGTEVQMFTLAHLLQTPVVLWVKNHATWARHAPCGVDRTLNDDVTQMSMYLNLRCNHFEVVCSMRM